MALSGTNVYTISRDDLILASFEKIGIAVEGEPIASSDVDTAARHLNMQIKACIAKGLQIWKRSTASITMVASQRIYTLGPSGNVVMTRPLRILECNRVTISDGNSVPMVPVTRNEYEYLPNKTNEGTPIHFHYDPVLTNGDMYVWSVPDTNAASTYTLDIVYSAPMDDMTGSLNDFDFPQEWYEAIMLGLAYRLSAIYGTELNERYLLRKDYKEAMKLAEDYDVEDGSVYLQPDTDGGVF